MVATTAAPPPPEDVPLLGRDLELQQLLGWLRATPAAGVAQAVLVRGLEGSGRHHLLRAAVAELRRDTVQPWRILSLRAQPGRSGVSLGLLRFLFHEIADVPEGTPLTSARAAIEHLVADAGIERAQERGVIDFLGELLSFEFRDNARLAAARRDPRMMGDLVRFAVGELFSAWCARGPVLLAVEHLDASDASSLAMFAFLLRRLQRRPLVLLGGCGEGFAGAELEPRRELVLGPVSTVRIAELVELVRGRAETSILHRAQGRPHFATQLARYVREGGDPDALPETLAATVQRRLFLLGNEDSLTLRRAAVLGERFWVEGLVALGESVAPLRALRALAARGLVQPSERARFRGVSEWRFVHPAVHRAALELGNEAQRRGLHSMAARWYAQRARALSEEVARQHHLAGEDQRAVACWMTATVEADHRGDVRAVLEHSDRALSVARAAAATLADDDVFTIRVRRADALHRLGRVRALDAELQLLAGLPTVARLLAPPRFELPRAAPSRSADADGPRVMPRGGHGFERRPVTLTTTRATLWSSFDARPGSGPMVLAPHESLESMGVRYALLAARRLGEIGRFDEALDILVPALALADRLGDRHAQARTRVLIITFLAQAGRAAFAELYERDLERLAELATDDVITPALAASSRATLRALRGDLGELALADFLQAADGFRRGGCMRESLDASLNAGATLLALGDLEAAMATLGDALRLARALDLPRQIGWSCSNLGLVECELGHFGSARVLLDEALVLAPELGDVRLHMASLCNLSVLALREGRAAQAHELALKARTLAGERGAMAAVAAAACAIALGALERHAEALEVCAEARALLGVDSALEQFDVELALTESEAYEACGQPPSVVAAPVRRALERFGTALERLRSPRLRRAYSTHVRAHRHLVRRAGRLGLALPASLLDEGR